VKSAFGSCHRGLRRAAYCAEPTRLDKVCFSRIELPGYYVCKGSGRIGCGINEGLGQDAHQSLTELDRGLQGRSVRCLSTCRLTAAAAVRREFATQAGDRLPRQIPRTLITVLQGAAHR
jgi:hypothetical protein